MFQPRKGDGVRIPDAEGDGKDLVALGWDSAIDQVRTSATCRSVSGRHAHRFAQRVVSGGATIAFTYEGKGTLVKKNSTGGRCSTNDQCTRLNSRGSGGSGIRMVLTGTPWGWVGDRIGDTIGWIQGRIDDLESFARGLPDDLRAIFWSLAAAQFALEAPITMGISLTILARSEFDITYLADQGVFLVTHCRGLCEDIQNALGKSMDVDAYTIGLFVFTKNDRIDEDLLAHEIQHVRQFEVLGDRFWDVYVGNGALSVMGCAVAGWGGTCWADTNLLERMAEALS
jgi:hypothetical protein